MEKLKCRFLSLFVLLPLLACIFISKDVNAVEYEGSGLRGMNKLEIGASSGSASSPTIPNSYSLNVNVPNPSAGGTLYTINPQLMADYGIPANSIALFNIRFVVPGYANNFEFGGFQGVSNGSIVDSNCVTNVYINNDRVADMTCALWVYYPSYTENTVIRTNTFFRAAGLNVAVNGVGYVKLKAGSGDVTSGDLETQIDRLTRLIPEQTDRIVTIERQIRDLLENLEASQGESLENALEAEREAEKSEYENQADESEATATQESSEAQGAATNLLSVVGQFIGVLTSAQPTNCTINGNLIPHLPLGNLNLCQNDPPAAIVVLGSLLLIAFVVPLAYHTVKRMINLIGSFQN